MKSITSLLFGAGASVGLVWGAAAADLLNSNLVPAPAKVPSCFASFYDYMNSSAEDCPLSWRGITLYGNIDVGAGYETHGVPFNGVYPNGAEALISKNSNRPGYTLIPNGLGQSYIGVKANETIVGEWSFLLNLQNGFDPYEVDPGFGTSR